MSESVDISIVIVSYNAADLLPKCLDAVADDVAASGVTSETIVVDNASTDGSAALVRKQYPSVQVIEAGRNGGMAFGNNVGIRAASGRTILLLNSDAFLLPGALRAMLDTLDAREDIGLVGPRLRNEDGSLQRSARGFPTVPRLATEFFYLRKLAPHTTLFNAFYQPHFDHDSTGEVPGWLMGAVMLVRSAVVDDVGPMDESYFMYGEEVDWQRRMRTAGWRVWFSADAAVVHLGGGSSRHSWGVMYQTQVCNHVRYLARTQGAGTARRARRMIASALAMRWLAYRVLALLPGGRRTQAARRAAEFAGALRAVRDLDVGSFTGSAAT